MVADVVAWEPRRRRSRLRVVDRRVVYDVIEQDRAGPLGSSTQPDPERWLGSRRQLVEESRMNELLLDPFRHNQWATQTLLVFCGALSPEHLDATTEGTFGGVLATLWHIVDAEVWYGGLATGEKLPWQDSDGDDVPSLDVVRERCGEMGAYWERFLAQPIDVEREVVTETEGDRPTELTKLGALIAQHLNHGNEHRGQVCTILTKLGMQPPSVDGWEYASATGRLRAGPTES